MIDCKILVVDDNAALIKSMRRVLLSEFRIVLAVTNPTLLPALLNDRDIDVVLLDMNFTIGKQSGKEGLFWLNHTLSFPFPPSVVIMTAFEDIDLAISSLKRGAVDFIIKPWSNEKLISVVNEALLKRTERKKELPEPETLIDFPDYLLQKYARIYAKPIPVLTVNAKKKLKDLQDTGNLELLDLCIEQTVLLSGSSELSAEDFHTEKKELTTFSFLSLEDREKQLIRYVLNENDRNLSVCAQILKITRQTLYNKIKKYNL